LDLTKCGELQELGENVGQFFPKLKRLVMQECVRLKRLPESIGHLTDLEHLDLSYCRRLGALPNAIVGLVSLRSLHLKYCLGLTHLPKELGKLTNLETLDVGICFTLSKLPACVGGLKMLKALDMGYSTITTLPKRLGNLKLLVRLEIRSCSNLLTVEALPEGLEDLSFNDCINLVEIPSLASMRSLIYLDLSHCQKLRCVRGLEFLATLKEIDTKGCTSIEGCRIGGVENRALEECDVRGSKVSVAYNNRWSEVRSSSSLFSVDDVTQLKKMKI
jgi:Leucine-rich repeat (LRR) protein